MSVCQWLFRLALEEWRQRVRARLSSICPSSHEDSSFDLTSESSSSRSWTNSTGTSCHIRMDHDCFREIELHSSPTSPHTTRSNWPPSGVCIPRQRLTYTFSRPHQTQRFSKNLKQTAALHWANAWKNRWEPRFQVACHTCMERMVSAVHPY